MSGLKPARVLHGRYFDISMTAVHSLLALAGLMLATFVVIEFFIAYLMYGVIGATMVATVVAFLSDRRHGGGRSAG